VKATKAHIKLNGKKLYGADGYAIKELLKIANLLHQAATTTPENIESIGSMTISSDLAGRLSRIKLCRSLASELVEKGALLYDHLGQELALRVYYLTLKILLGDN
jgi:clusterin-associated protein 1